MLGRCPGQPHHSQAESVIVEIPMAVFLGLAHSLALLVCVVFCSAGVVPRALPLKATEPQ